MMDTFQVYSVIFKQIKLKATSQLSFVDFSPLYLVTFVRVLVRRFSEKERKPCNFTWRNKSFLNRDIVKYGPKANVSAFRQGLHLDPNDTSARYLQPIVSYNSDAVVVQRSIFILNI